MRIFNTRLDFLHFLPKNLVCCELGVFKGDFAEQILVNTNPKELVLYDLFSNGQVFSADVDGNGGECLFGTNMQEMLEYKFSGYSKVSVNKGTSLTIEQNYKDDYFDFIYIDADHSYSACCQDLKICFDKTKSGGIIGLHDYDINLEKTRNPQHYQGFGVKRAVDEFCENKSQKIKCKANDGYVSCFIEVEK